MVHIKINLIVFLHYLFKINAGFDCPPNGDVYHRNPDNCAKFYMCSNQNVVECDCPARLYFNPDINVRNKILVKVRFNRILNVGV